MKKKPAENRTKTKKYIRLGLIMAILLFSIHALIFAALTPVYESCLADFVVPAIVCDIIRESIDIVDTTIRTIGFAIIAVVFFMKAQKKLPFILIYIGASAFRYLGSVIMSLVFNHSIREDEIFISVSSFALDIIFLGLALLIIRGFAKAYHRRSAIKQKRSMLFNDKEIKVNPKTVYPFKKIFDSQNQLQGCLLALGAYLSLIRIANRSVAIVNQEFTEEFKYFDGLFSIIGGYAIDILTFIISYSIACLLISCLHKIYTKRKAAYELFESIKKDSEEENETAVSEDTAV